MSETWKREVTLIYSLMQRKSEQTFQHKISGGVTSRRTVSNTLSSAKKKQTWNLKGSGESHQHRSNCAISCMQRTKRRVDRMQEKIHILFTPAEAERILEQFSDVERGEIERLAQVFLESLAKPEKPRDAEEAS